MPNGIKYNISAESLALKKGNFYIATGDVGKGPTSTSGFYNGITPPANGYTIYLNKGSGGPSIYVASNDSELISVTNKISGSNYSTVAQCLSYFAEQTDKMVLNNDYSPTITNGLVLNLDAGFTPSYPRNGTTWYDISVSGPNNVTLTNGPTYNSIGYLTFDGSDDYANFYAPSLGTTTTVEMLCKMGSAYDGKMFFGFLYYDVWCGNSCLGYNTSFGDLYGISSSSVSSLGLVGNWKHYVFEMRSDVSYTNNKIFINGVSQTLSQQFGSENSNARNFNSGSGRISSWLADLNYPMPMDTIYFRVYNRALTTSEITQNYYGGNVVTNGLILFLDGGNIISYPETGTVWYDMTTSNYSVTGSNLQLGKNSRYSLFSDGNNPEIATSAILNNDYHTIEMVLMFKGTGDYPNGWTGSWEQFFGYYSGGSDRSPGVWRWPSERRIHWRYDPGNTGVDFGKNLAYDEFDLNTYYHITVTKNGGIAEAWVNGTFVNSNSVSSPKTSGNSVLRFFDYYTSGLMEIQVCKIYNRVLTNQEIYQNYNSLANRF